MARPAYIMLAQSGAVDQTTNGISFFNVIESIEAEVATGEHGEGDGKPSPASPAAGSTMRLAAVWMKEDGDTPDVLFESELLCTAPSGTPVFAGKAPAFSFPPNIHFHRLTMNDMPLPVTGESGTYSVEALLRRVGQTEVVARQSFPFRVSVSLSRTNKPTEPAAPAE